MKETILIVEDDRRIVELVVKNLEAAGFACRAVYEGTGVVEAVTSLDPALVILDLNLPGVDGLEITRRLRRSSEVPILMLTARSSEGDKILGFEIGADDYLTKPFSPGELVARVRALLRRTGHGAAGVVERGALRIDPSRRTVTRRGEPVGLTSLEFDLLHFLATRPGRVYSREDLMRHVWGDDRVVDGRSIDSLVSRLRRKLESDPARPTYVQTVWGAGYRFAEYTS